MNKKKEERIRICISISESAYNRLNLLCSFTGCTKSKLIDNSIRNHKPIKTLEELADYYNVCRDYPSDFADMIYDNGWHDDLHEMCGICHDDEGNRVELNENGDAEVIYA